MSHRVRFRKLVLLLALALGTCDARAAPSCAPTKAANLRSVAPNLLPSSSACPGDWASIKPADFKEPIENPSGPSWREWTLLASGLGVIVVFLAVAVRLARRRTGAR